MSILNERSTNFEMLCSAFHELLKLRQEPGWINETNRRILRGNAIFAFERTAARRFHIRYAVRQIIFVVKLVGQGEPIHVDGFGADKFSGRFCAGDQSIAKRGKFKLRLAGHDVIGCFTNRRHVRLETDFRPAEHNDDFGMCAFHFGDNLR